MDSEALLALAARVEAATGPNRELFIEAWMLITGRLFPERSIDDIRALPSFRRFDALLRADGWLDAALSQMPEGWHVSNLTERNEDNQPHCCLTENDDPCSDVAGNGLNMALSLLAACLRARATQSGASA